MTRDTQTIQDDIAYMRALAHEGRHAPLLAGPVLVAAAVVPAFVAYRVGVAARPVPEDDRR